MTAQDPSAPAQTHRREVLRLAAASIALAGVAGCDGPDEFGHPLHARARGVPDEEAVFATVLELQGLGRGVLVRTRGGHAVKIEGNPAHPASLGATDVFAEAAVLSLHDPARSRRVRENGRVRDEAALGLALAAEQAVLTARGGRGLHLLTGPVASPTTARLIAAVLRAYPEAAWHQHDPLADDAALESTRRVFDRPVAVLPDLARARVVLSLGADLLGAGPAQIRQARDWSRARAEGRASGNPPLLIVAEAAPTLTGAKADRRVVLRPEEMEPFAWAVAAALDVPGLGSDARAAETADQGHAGAPGTAAAGGAAPSVPAIHPVTYPGAASVAALLRQAGAAALVVAGRGQPITVHTIAHTMNQALGSMARRLVPPPLARPEPMGGAALRPLAAAMKAGAVTHLAMLDVNPAYDAPADLGFTALLRHVPFTLHMGMWLDETAHLCRWHLPLAHPLESWGDTRAFDGTAGIRQPATVPLAPAARTVDELLAALAGSPARAEHLVRETWRAAWGTLGFETRWATALEAGVVAAEARGIGGEAAPRPAPAATPGIQGTAPSGTDDAIRLPSSPARLEPGLAPRGTAEGDAPSPGRAPPDRPAIPVIPLLTAVFTPDPGTWDGSHAENAWLQEAPRPLTKIAWGNAALLAPATLAALGLRDGDEIELEHAGRRVRAPVWPVPGHAPDTITLPLGGGRAAAGGEAGAARGFDAYRLRTTDAPWIVPGVALRPVGRTFASQWGVIATQRDLAADTTDIARVVAPGQSFPPPAPAPSLYPDWRYEGHAWAMTIDLDACIGCNACVIACQAENNVPVVGPREVARGREMHWLRVDLHRQGPPEAPVTLFTPMPCMHCEKAPCEVVCPVNATVHDHEGLNVMVYPRCIGTRTCSNNCPYKIRRFNWFDYARAENGVMVRNPDVPLRPRGVIEKCTYCSHRIAAARARARQENRPIGGDEVATACQRACPTEAIVFGDANNPDSAVSGKRRDGRNYAMLGHLDTRPRTTYLARVRLPDADRLTGTGPATDGDVGRAAGQDSAAGAGSAERNGMRDPADPGSTAGGPRRDGRA